MNKRTQDNRKGGQTIELKSVQMEGKGSEKKNHIHSESSFSRKRKTKKFMK